MSWPRDEVILGPHFGHPIEAKRFSFTKVTLTVHFELPQTEDSKSSVIYLKIEENQGAKSAWVDVTNIVDF